MKKLLITLLMFSLTACVSGISPEEQARMDKDKEFRKTLPAPNANYGKMPDNHLNLIKSYMSGLLKDPDSAKYSAFTQPKKTFVIKKQNYKDLITDKDVYYGYSSCVMINAKNSYGGYTGNSLYWFFFYNGKIVKMKEIKYPVQLSLASGNPKESC